MLECSLVPSDNTNCGLLEFGRASLFVDGRPRGRAADARLGCAVLRYMVLMESAYAMRGTPQQYAVFRAEGNYDDFARINSVDFQAWVKEDLLGAGSFHLLRRP